MGNRLLDPCKECTLPARRNCAAHRRWTHRMLRCGSIEDGSAQPVAIGMPELERRELLGVRLEQPRMIDQREQNESLARRKGAAHAAHDWARRKSGAGHRRPLALLRARSAAPFPAVLASG